MCLIRPVGIKGDTERLGKIFRKFSFKLNEKLEGMEKEQSLIFMKMVKIDPPVMLSSCMMLEEKEEEGVLIERREENQLIPDYIEYMMFENEDVCPVCEQKIKDHNFYVALPVGISLNLRVLDVSKLDTIIRDCYKSSGIDNLFMYKF